MRLLRALVGIDAPPEARFFLSVGAFAAVVDVVYWFVTYEDAGTFLLGGFALAALLMGTRLAASAESRREKRPLPPFAGGFAPGDGGTAADDPQRPFLDESGRLPTPTFAPFALGMGVAVAATALVFGPAPLVVGAIPLAWGAWTWLRGASDELSATERDDAKPATEGLRPVDQAVRPTGR